MSYFLYFHTGCGNHGCEALVRSTVALLKDNIKLYSTGYKEDIEYNIQSIVDTHEDVIKMLPHKSWKYILAASQIKLFHSTELYTKFSRETFLKEVKKGDVCLSIGGDNYCYGATDMLADLNRLIRQKGAKTVLWGCSIDPEVINDSVAADLRQYDLITVREPLTLEAMQQAGVVNNVKSVADPAFLLEMETTQLPDGFTEGSTIGLNLSPLIFNYTDHKEEVLKGFYHLVQEILDTTEDAIALIPHVVKLGNDDNEVLEPIYNKFKDTGRVILVGDQNCMRLKYIISKCRLFIGARTHATIAAYSTMVPTLVIGYSVKSRGIAKDLFGTYKNYVLPIQEITSSDNLIDAFNWLEVHAKEIHKQLSNVIPKYKVKAAKARQYLMEIVG